MNSTHFEIWFIFLVIALGFAGGFMAGMLGVGGGIVFVPVFQEILRYHSVESDKVPYVLANSLLIVMAVGISGTVKQYKLKNTHLISTLTTGMAAVVSSLILSYLLRYYGINDQKLFNYIFATILLLTAIRMWMGKKTEIKKDAILKIPDWKYFIPAGFFAGIITALTGLGGGVIMVPYFNKILKLPIKFATGLSLSVIPIIAFPLMLFYSINHPIKDYIVNWQTGYIIWPAAVPMIIAAGIASPYGVKTAHKMSSKALLTIFLIFIALNCLKMLFL